MAEGPGPRTARVQQGQRQTGELSAPPGRPRDDDPWARRSTSTLPRGTSALAFGESRLDQIARELALTDTELSRIIGLPTVMLDRWKLGVLQPGAATVARYERLIQTHYRLYGMFVASDVLWWLRAERDDLGGRCAIDAMCAGEFGRVELALDRYDAV